MKFEKPYAVSYTCIVFLINLFSNYSFVLQYVPNVPKLLTYPSDI